MDELQSQTGETQNNRNSSNYHFEVAYLLFAHSYFRCFLNGENSGARKKILKVNAISYTKIHFMALHFLAKPSQDYYCQKVWKQKLHLCLLWRPIEILHDVKELEKSGVQYIRSLDITGSTYFRNDFTPLWSAEKDVWNRWVRHSVPIPWLTTTTTTIVPPTWPKNESLSIFLSLLVSVWH